MIRRILLVAGALVLVAHAASGAIEDPVKLDTGLAAGAPASSPGVRVYKGLPFAAPPIGPLRWRPPQPPQAWTGVRDATKFGPRCMQGQGSAPDVSEDCLHLNVWTAAASAAERRPERELDVLRDRISRHAESRKFVVRSPAMQEVLELAAQVAPLDTTVLVYGESGTGKEFVVRMIHEQSARASGSFVSVNCAALTETPLESELFGHVRGAFTGAVRDKPGLFEVASDGTLFLDEIGEVAPTIQAKLLRALQEREIRRVGVPIEKSIRTRVTALTETVTARPHGLGALRPAHGAVTPQTSVQGQRCGTA